MRHFLGLRGSAAFTISTADVTPNAVNWTDVSGTGGGTTNTQTISGINTTITLSINWTYSGVKTISYSKNGGAFVDLYSGTGGSSATVSVSNNDTIAWKVIGNGIAATFTIRNNSDSNVTLDTFVVTDTSGGGG